jgi:alkylation response protein AidB-like acyl-CoA dehydrogenase
MDFGLNEEQELLQQSAREFLARECPPAFVREVAESADGYPRALYRTIAGLGWSGLIVPEAYGGAGLSMLDMALLLEEIGRAMLPGPFMSSLLASQALLAGGSTAQRKTWLPRLASGDAVVTVAFTEANDRLDADGVTARAKRTRDGFRLQGTKMFVADAEVADALIVPCRTGGKGAEGVTVFIVPRDAPGMTVKPLPTIDITRRSTEVALVDVTVPKAAVLGGEGKGWRVLSRVQDAACVALAADSLGGAEKTLELAVEYAKVREQFGRPIGSFQAVKHMAAEMVSEIEPSRALVWYAAYAFDALPREASRAASMAKARLSEVYMRAADRAVQIHGGIGFTWEHDMHLWFKRAKWNEYALGDAGYHRERVAQLAKF